MFIKRSNNAQVGRLRSARRRTFLRVEGLEDRRVPAFLAPIDFATGATTVAAGVGDFNGDGFIDVVSVGNLSGRGVATVELNDGTGHFRASAPSPTGNSPVAVTVGDFDGDGKQDIATLASYYTGGLTVLKGNGDGTFQPPEIYTVQTPPTEFQAEDVNGDGRPDLVAGNHYFNTVSVFLNNGTGAFLPKVDYPGGGSPTSVGLADFNGDGKADIVATNQSAAGTVTVQLGTGTGSFLPATSAPAGPAPLAQAIGDYNGDGKADLAVANSGTPNLIDVLMGNGDGTFGAPTVYNIGISPLDIRRGDFNGDGKLDLMERTGAGFSVELGAGDGTFGAAVTIGAPTGTSLLAADFNGDGGLDVASASAAGTVSVMLNDNSGITGAVVTANLTLAAPSSVAAGVAFPVTVSATDLAGNPKPDFAGTVTLLSSDPRVAAFSYAFTPADGGRHTFPAIALTTVGPQSLTATSAFIGTGSQAITVGIGPAARLGVTAPGLSAAGDPVPLTIIALDSYGNMGAGYAGTVHFTSSDPQAVLPADYTFTAADAGIHHFAATLKTAGYDSLSAVDVVATTLAGTSGYVYVTPLSAVGLAIAGGSGGIGAYRPVTVTAVDMYGNVATTDNGLVHLSASDPAAVLPPDAALVGGRGTFLVKLMTEGPQTLTATRPTDPSRTATETVVGAPAAAGSFDVAGFPAAVAGTAQSFTVRVIDILGKLATRYAGTVNFISSDYQAGLPASYTFTAADAGVHTFAATLKTAGPQTLRVSDYALGATGAQAGIAIRAATATTITAVGPHNAAAGTAIPMTVTAYDPFGNVAAGYAGKVHFTSNDAQAALPTDYTFTAADAGTHTFPVTLKTSNTRLTPTSITAVDAANPALTATLGGLDVVSGPAARFILTPPSNATVGVAFSLKVTVLDAFGNKVQSYAGTVHFADTLAASGLPADYTFNAADAGVHTFNVTLSTAASQTLTIIEPGNPLVAGSATLTPKASGGSGGGGGGGGGGGKA